MKVPASPMSHLHLAPTLLEVVGVQAPAAFQGRKSDWRKACSEGGLGTIPRAFLRLALRLAPRSSSVATDCGNPFRPESRRVPRLLSGFAIRASSWSCGWSRDRRRRCTTWKADPAETHPSVAGPALAARRRLLQAAREHLEKTVTGRDTVMGLRARLRDLRCEISSREWQA